MLLYWLYRLYCSGRLEEVHKCNDCSYTFCTEMVLHWHCVLNNVLCSTAIDFCFTFRHKLLDTERYVTSYTVTLGEPNIGHSSGLCLHTASCNQLSLTVLVSVYTQLHVTNCHSQFRSLSIHTASCNQLSPTVQFSVYTQLHVTNCHPQFRSLSIHSFM